MVHELAGRRRDKIKKSSDIVYSEHGDDECFEWNHLKQANLDYDFTIEKKRDDDE